MTALHFEYVVDGNNFLSAGSASDDIKNKLKSLGINPKTIRRVAVSMYEGEINMVIHAGGGKVFVDIYQDSIEIVLKDTGKGIENIELAMKEGYSTAPNDIRALGFGAGMGLPNIKKYADNLVINSEVGKGTELIVKINFDEDKNQI